MHAEQFYIHLYLEKEHFLETKLFSNNKKNNLTPIPINIQNDGWTIILCRQLWWMRKHAENLLSSQTMYLFLQRLINTPWPSFLSYTKLHLHEYYYYYLYYTNSIYWYMYCTWIYMSTWIYDQTTCISTWILTRAGFWYLYIILIKLRIEENETWYRWISAWIYDQTYNKREWELPQMNRWQYC